MARASIWRRRRSARGLPSGSRPGATEPRASGAIWTSRQRRAGAQGASSPCHPPPKGVGDMQQSIRVLLVDDQVLFREGLTELLSSQKEMQVVGEAGDGLEAVEKAKELRPDLVIMDIRMPSMNGLEACRLIKAVLPDTRVVRPP